MTRADEVREAALAAFGVSTAPIVADGMAAAHAESVRVVDVEHDRDLIMRTVSASAGTVLIPPFAARLYSNELRTRHGLFVLHSAQGTEAEMTMLCSAFSWTRAAIVDVHVWGLNLGLETVVARLRVSDWRGQDLARRAGFKFVPQAVRGQTLDGEAVSLWRLTLLCRDFLPKYYRSLGRDLEAVVRAQSMESPNG